MFGIRVRKESPSSFSELWMSSSSLWMSSSSPWMSSEMSAENIEWATEASSGSIRVSGS